LVINFVTIVLFWLDKGKARKNSWRISEKTLIGMSFLGGFVGALFAMDKFRHKTKKSSFQIWIFLSLFFWLLILLFFVKFKVYLNLT